VKALMAIARGLRVEAFSEIAICLEQPTITPLLIQTALMTIFKCSPETACGSDFFKVIPSSVLLHNLG
jgi:hypothetical protein